MKICIVGAGAMGCMFGGFLAKAGHEVWLVSPSPDHIEALAHRGLIMRHGGSTHEIAVKASHDPADAGVCDAVLVMTKFPDTTPAIISARPVIGADTAVVTLQNGIGNVEKMSAVVDPAQILFGVTALGAIRTGPGAIEVTAYEGARTSLWSLADRLTTGLEAFVAALAGAGLDAVAAPDVKIRIWRKLCLNAGASALAALVELRVGDLVDLAPVRELVRNLVGEVVAVAAKEGVRLNHEEAYVEVIEECRRHPEHAPSLLVDMVSERKTEIESLNGAVVEFGRRHGIPTPYNHAVASIVLAREQSYGKRFSPR